MLAGDPLSGINFYYFLEFFTDEELDLNWINEDGRNITHLAAFNEDIGVLNSLLDSHEE